MHQAERSHTLRLDYTKQPWVISSSSPTSDSAELHMPVLDGSICLAISNERRPKPLTVLNTEVSHFIALLSSGYGQHAQRSPAFAKPVNRNSSALPLVSSESLSFSIAFNPARRSSGDVQNPSVRKNKAAKRKYSPGCSVEIKFFLRFDRSALACGVGGNGRRLRMTASMSSMAVTYSQTRRHSEQDQAD